MLVVTHVMSTSPVRKLRGLVGPGLLIDEVNDIPVKTLTEFRSAVKKSKESGYLTMLTPEKRFVVLSVESIVKEEDRLSKLFLYKKSGLIQELEASMKLSKKVVKKEVSLPIPIPLTPEEKPYLVQEDEQLDDVQIPVDATSDTITTTESIV